MKHLLSLFLLITLIISCGETHPKTKTVTQEAPATEAMASVQLKDGQHSKVVNTYLELKDALVATDGEKAQAIAQKLADAAGENASLSEIQSYAQEIAATTATEVQRTHFENLSNAVYALAQESALAAGNLYLQYCPMAFNNKGAYWLSASDQIRNPYFGDKMLKCGVVEKTLE